MMFKKSSSAKVRLNFDVAPELKKNLIELQQRTGSTSITEVLRKSLALLDMVTANTEDKGEMVLRKKDGKEVVVRIL